MRSSALGLSLAFCFAAAAANGQDLISNSSVAVPLVGHVFVETGVSAYRVDAYVGRAGERQAFPGDLEFSLSLLRVSFSPVRNFALGLQIPYCWTTYDEPGLEASFSSRGRPGLGGFLDWAPETRGRKFQPALRIEYLSARPETEKVLTLSDGVNRWAATFQLIALAGLLPAHWRGIGSIRAEYGPPHQAGEPHFESCLQLQAGPRLASLGAQELHALGIAGYRASSAARQEGNFFRNRTSQGGFAGLLVSWEAAPQGSPSHALSVSLIRDIRPRNALLGWRAILSLKSGF